MISAISPVCLGTLISGRQLCELLHALMFMLTSDDSCGSHDNKLDQLRPVQQIFYQIYLYMSLSHAYKLHQTFMQLLPLLYVLHRYFEAL